uniref:succinate--CoA ligase (GDP-forming) n=1 Tax=Xiphophorus couchianus TaxID=32473 RepID=A0A3B5LNQ2_9TELE
MLAVFPRSELILPLSCSSFQCSWLTPRRWLNLQEYQSKKLMQDSGVAVQRFYVADTASEAQEAAKRLNAKEIVLKAQILAGGRGKGVFDSGLKGGVHLTKDPAVVGELAKRMLGFNLITKQTPKDGVKVKTVMVAEALDISRETYFAILMDRACNGPVMVGSPQGGMDIEEVADTTPELIFKEVIDIYKGVQDDQALRMAANLGFKGPLQRQAADQIKRLYDLFLKVDATQVEVNPLGETPEGQGTFKINPRLSDSPVVCECAILGPKMASIRVFLFTSLVYLKIQRWYSNILLQLPSLNFTQALTLL